MRATNDGTILSPVRGTAPGLPGAAPGLLRPLRAGRAHRARREDSVAVLLVDVANVVGARPDGWWRDRAGATERLLGRLARAGAELTTPDGSPITAVVAVVEGRARGVRAPEGIRVVRAAGSGDDALVACAADLVGAGTSLVAVTADRGLRARLPAGTGTVGPGWLLERLAARDGSGTHDRGPHTSGRDG